MAGFDGSRRRLCKTNSGLRMVADKEQDKSPFELEEPPWAPDSDVHSCMKCDKKFDFMNRRHHCRRCGSCFCSKCCKHKMDLKRMYFVDPVRICEDCAPLTKKENDFFDKQLVTLREGGTFILKSTSTPEREDNEDNTFTCKLTSDHRFIEFIASPPLSHDNVEVSRIQAIQILTGGQDSQGNIVGTGIALKYTDFQDVAQNLRLVAASKPNRNQSMVWLAAMQKALKLLYDSKRPQNTE